jgi:hypothetical protein
MMSRIWVAGLGVDAEAGWQLANEWGSVAVLGGIAWRDYMLSPDDPNSSLGSNMLNARFTLQGHLAASPQWGSFFYAEYITGVDEWFAEAKPYWQLDNGLKLGPEFSVSGGRITFTPAQACRHGLGVRPAMGRPFLGRRISWSPLGHRWNTRRALRCRAHHPRDQRFLNGRVSRPSKPSSCRVCTPIGISFQRLVLDREPNTMSQIDSVLA